MSVLHGVRSFESLKADATEVGFDGCKIRIASLQKIIMSKKALGRPRDLAVIEILEQTLNEINAKEP